MDYNKHTYTPLDREDISNPYNKLSHEELMAKAGVLNIEQNYSLEELPSGKFIVSIPEEENTEKNKNTVHNIKG